MPADGSSDSLLKVPRTQTRSGAEKNAGQGVPRRPSSTEGRGRRRSPARERESAPSHRRAAASGGRLLVDPGHVETAAAKSGARGRQLVDPGGSDRGEVASGGGPGAGTPPVASPPAARHPRSAGRPVRRREEEGRARAGTPRWPPHRGPRGQPPPGRGPAGHGPGSARPPPRFPPTRSPGPVPARSGRAAPAVNGEEAGTEEAGRADRGRAPSLPPLLPRPWSAGEAGKEEGRRTDGRTAPDAHAPPGPPRARADKPLCRGLTFNRSQRGSCSATYETPTQKQVVYEWFSARFPTNVRCVTGEGAAAFPAAPRFPGRGALRTGPRSRRAAGHAPSSPRARGAVGGGAARRRGQAGDRLSEANRGSAALPYRSAWAGF